MKKILYIALSVFAIWSCTEFDDSRIWKELNDHENRIKTLEDICRKRNEDIKALQSILNALQNNDYVTGVSPIMEGGEVVGYTIKFTRGEAVSIYHGMNGADGSNGSDGSNGTNG